MNKDLILGSRTTEAIFEDGSVETVEDDWTARKTANKRLKAQWFGCTVFTFRGEEAAASAAERKEGLGWPTEEEEPAAGGEALDSEPLQEESEEFRKSRAAAEPTPEQRENHFLENHAVYRPWCEVCVKSRGLGTQHRRTLKKEAAESSEGPRIFSDYFFMSTDEDSVPMLALKFSRSKRIAATALPRKGISELGCKFMSNFIKMTGVKRFVNFSDGEPAMKALKEESARKVAEVEAISRECPVGDHQKNGEIESAVRELKRQMRAVRMSLEGRLGRALADDDPLLMWIPTFAGDCIAFHRRGADGKTPWERETGRKWRRPCLEFGEKVMIKEAFDRSSGPKRDWQARMIPVRYVGHHARTGAVMGLTSEGVKFGTGVSRLAASERWSTEGLEELRGLPWDLQPRLREARAIVGSEGVSVPRFPHLPAGSPAPRSFYVTREDVKPAKYGYTRGCKSCDNLMRTGKSDVGHNNECRERVFRLMERDESVRVKEYHNRVQEAVAKQPQMPQQPAAATTEEQQPESSTEECESSRKRESVPGEVPESPSKRPVPASQWEQEGHGRYRKRQAEVPAEVLQTRASESGPSEVIAEPPAAQIAAEASAPASAESGPVSVEDFLKEEAVDIDSVVAYEVLGSTVELGEQKNEFIAAASEQVRKVYEHQGISLSSLEVTQIAALQVGIAGCRVREIFARDGLSRAASHFGLRPGFVLDLTGPRAGGPNVGRQWCLDKEEDTAELQQLISEERPVLLTGSSRHDLSHLLGTRQHGVGPEQAALRTEKAQKQFKACVRFYRKQHEEQRSFLHEHPAGAASWQDQDMLALQSLPGVYTVEGPTCYWNRSDRSGSSVAGKKPGHSIFRSKTRFVTNSRVLAEALGRGGCDSLDVPWRRQLEFAEGLAGLSMSGQPKMVCSVLTGLRQQMLQDGHLSDLDFKYGGPVPSQPTFEADSEELQEDYNKFFDNISGEELPPDLVAKARQEEISWVRSINLYDKVPRAEADSRGIRPLPIRWVDANKGDRAHYNVRSRLVGKELKAKTKHALLAHELFSAMPPWEMVKSLLSLLVSDGVSAESLVLGVFDISRAHFMAPATRELYVEIPDEDRGPGEENLIGRLNRSMYGFRDASHNWMEDWQELLQEEGYKIGVANPALFWNQALSSRGAVHGDDFYVLGTVSAVDRMAAALKSRYSVRESHRLGFGEGCTQHATILNRVVSLGELNGRRYVQIEPDRRHVELIVSSLGLDKGNTKSVTTPSVKPSDAEAEQFQHGPKLSASETSLYRSCVMRASFLSQDRADLGESVKALAQGMAAPARAHLQALKRLGRYLLHRPTVAVRFWQQAFCSTITCMVDSDHAADRMTRKSTTGMVVRLGAHTIKSTSNLQTSVGLNVSEAEYYALVHGAAHGLGLRSYFADLGLEMDVVIQSDSNAARAFASRRGLGKQRHVMTRYLWLQERVRCKHLQIVKIHTDDNCSDILTKSVSHGTLEKHMKSMGFLVVEASVFHKSTKV